MGTALLPVYWFLYEAKEQSLKMAWKVIIISTVVWFYTNLISEENYNLNYTQILR